MSYHRELQYVAMSHSSKPSARSLPNGDGFGMDFPPYLASQLIKLLPCDKLK